MAHGVHERADEEAVGQFIWELKHSQPPPHPAEQWESVAEANSEDTDPFNVPPARDPV